MNKIVGTIVRFLDDHFFNIMIYGGLIGALLIFIWAWSTDTVERDFEQFSERYAYCMEQDRSEDFCLTFAGSD